jgi:2-oxoglutarate ferredoxin oxidoreductase subunit delta
MAKVRGAIVVDTEKCKGCGVCVVACPAKVIGLAKEVNSKGYNYAYMANPESCVGCTSCGLVCPDSAITVYKAKAEA